MIIHHQPSIPTAASGIARLHAFLHGRVTHRLSHAALFTLAILGLGLLGSGVAYATNYSITYNDSFVTDMPTDIAATTLDSSVNVSSTTPARSSFDFKGWCTTLPTGSNGNLDTCSGTTYTSGSPYTLTGATNTLTLYAMWKKSPTMQSITDAELAALLPSTGSTATLEDERDHQTYTVAKLADGKYWMTENLNLAGGTALSADDTDVTSTYISGFTTQGGLTKSGNTITLPASSTSGFSDNATAYVYNSGNKTNCGASGQNTPCYSYYSWIAATLGGKQSNGSTAQTSNGYNAAASICPKGWRLPTSTTSNANAQVSSNWKTGDWYALAKQYGADLNGSHDDGTSASGGNFNTNAGPGTIPNFLLAGFYSANKFINGGAYGGYWSATSYSSSYANAMYFTSSEVHSANNSNRSGGFSVRCIFVGPSMQGATVTSLAAAMPNDGDTTTLRDTRDGKKYSVAKLADGKYWMVENLNLAGGTALSADDTDVTSTYINGLTTQGGLTRSGNTITLPASSTSGFSSDTTAYVYNSGNNTTSCGSSQPCNSYYSWIAATLGGKQSNGSTAQTSNGYNAAASICPKGWRLPTATTSNANPTSGTNYQTGDFYQMATQYGMATGSYNENPDNSPTFASMAGPGTTPGFLFAGYYFSSQFRDGGSYGYYWSATSYSSAYAYGLYFSSSNVYSALDYTRRQGFSVRCVFGGQ